MSSKFCPFGFFSFYVNKSQAQAGGGHHCVEEQCALWNEEMEECSIKSGCMAIGGIIEMFAAGRVPIMNEQPKLSVFEKLKLKKQQTEAAQPIQSAIASTVSVSTPVADSTQKEAPSELTVKVEQPVENKEAKKLPVINTELAPPNLPATELPVVSATPSTKEDIL